VVSGSFAALVVGELVRQVNKGYMQVKRNLCR
jgi:hypothetical protein